MKKRGPRAQAVIDDIKRDIPGDHHPFLEREAEKLLVYQMAALIDAFVDLGDSIIQSLPQSVRKWLGKPDRTKSGD